MIQKVLFSFIFLFISQTALGLVDYSDESQEFKPKKRAIKRNAPPSKAGAVRSTARSNTGVTRSSGPSGMFDLRIAIDSQEVQSENTTGKVSTYQFDGHFQTPYNIFIDVRYWMAKTDQEAFAESSSNQSGNSTVKIGFNWLKFGQGQDNTTIDFYTGGVFKSTSELGSSRTDKIFGLETTKTFYNFVLGLGYELRATGTPDSELESDIGNISKITAAIGWRVSPDINFALESVMYTVAEGDNNNGQKSVSQKGSFSYLEPKLGLTISPLVQLELGGNFRTKKLKDTDSFLGAKLWDIKAAYGNTIFTGLNISI